MTDDLITGLAIMSDRGAVIPGKPDRHAIMMISVFGVPADVAKTFADPVGWSQRIITGRAVMDEFLSLNVQREAVRNLSEEEPYYRAMRVDQLVTSPIWRV